MRGTRFEHIRYVIVLELWEARPDPVWQATAVLRDLTTLHATGPTRGAALTALWVAVTAHARKASRQAADARRE